ncbi:MAG: MBL fold metallo-hydrolase, partial [Patescibacteria group bacterium]|nr:MBL fold metallo-hydrolase [Patescibacteria group bacterium]
MTILRTMMTLGLLSWTIGQFAAAAPFEEGANAGEAPSKLVVTCWGAAGSISGSLHVLDTGNGRWMIDCGTVFAEGPQTDGWEQDEVPSGSVARFTPIPVEAAGIDALLLTHAHADHCGRIPLLVNSGFRGPIIATSATAALLGPMLSNAVRFDL